MPSFCAYCLGEDWDEGRDAYFRRQWCIAGVAHCHQHGELLQRTSPCCWQANEPQWGLVDGRVRLYCRHCFQPIGLKPDSDRAREPLKEFDQLTYSAEQLLAKAVLYGEADWPDEVIGCTASQFVKLIDDIAFFLYRPDDRSLPSNLWSFPIWQLANISEFGPLLRHGSGCVDEFPLDHGHPMTRYARLQACMLVLFPCVAIHSDKARWNSGPVPSISWLYGCFTPIGKRMFTHKATSWPDRIVLPSVEGNPNRFASFWQTPVRTLVPSLAKKASR